MKTNFSVRIALFLLTAGLSISVSALAQVPRIDLVTPASGHIGATVTISGANFSPNPSDNIV